MTSGLRTTHPNGTTFEYVPNYRLVKIGWIGGYVQQKIKHMKESGVWITYPDGVRIFRPNSFYDHISPLTPSEKDIF